ncbi:MAG: glycoside hydrolase family 15 protein, partial [Paracoccaceae bacterium]
YPDGRPFWKGIQLDEVGFPILLAAKLREAGQLDADEGALVGLRNMVENAVRFIVRNGPITPEDRWEENSGLNGFTLAVLIAALVAGAEWLQGEAQAMALATADDWNARIEEWTYAEGTALAKAHGVAGHYIRLAPLAGIPLADQQIEVRNREGLKMPVCDIVAMDFLALARFGLRKADDTRMQNTVKVCDAVLGTDTPNGQVFHRYNEDGYGEHADGAPFDGTGIGRGWPLLGGERGHLALMSGEDARPYLAAMAAMTSPCGMIPEQVWDTSPLPDVFLAPGAPSGSAMPLVWAHSEYLKLASAIVSGRPVELLQSVERRYDGQRPAPKLRHWRSDTPVDTIAKGATLRIEDINSFTLRVTFDDWADMQDLASIPQAFGMHAVVLDLDQRVVKIEFTRFYLEGWEGKNHEVDVV